jgi:PPIC-type PPIASE domain
MSTAIGFGKRQLTIEVISQHLLSSNLLPLVLREILVDEILADWQAERPEELIYQPEEFAAGCDRLAQADGYEGLTEGQIEIVVDRTLKLQRFKQAGWGNRVNSYFLERKDDLDRIVYSIMQVDDREVAQELFFRIQAGEGSFAELAFKYSQTEAAKDGGKVEPQLFNRLHPELYQFINYLEEGELSPVFNLDGLYTFIRLDYFLPARLDDTMRSTLIDELFDRWIQSRIAEQIGLINADSQVIPPEFERVRNLEAVAEDNFNFESEATAIQVDARSVEDNSGELISASFGGDRQFTQVSSSFYLPNRDDVARTIKADRQTQANRHIHNFTRQVKNIIVGTISIAVASSLFALGYQQFDRGRSLPLLGSQSGDRQIITNGINRFKNIGQLNLNSSDNIPKLAEQIVHQRGSGKHTSEFPNRLKDLDRSPKVSLFKGDLGGLTTSDRTNKTFQTPSQLDLRTTNNKVLDRRSIDNNFQAFDRISNRLNIPAQEPIESIDLLMPATIKISPLVMGKPQH